MLEFRALHGYEVSFVTNVYCVVFNADQLSTSLKSMRNLVPDDALGTSESYESVFPSCSVPGVEMYQQSTDVITLHHFAPITESRSIYSKGIDCVLFNSISLNI